MAHISIIGTGNMGQAIAAVVARGGHSVQQLSEDDASIPATGEFVVLAVPYGAVATVVAERGSSLEDKVVVDISNPVDFETFDDLLVPPDSSASAEIAAALPASRVVKAFSTTFAGTVASGAIGDMTTTVLIAGDDTAAKSALADIVRSGGLNAVEVGGLKRARELEAFGLLQISLAAAEKISWTGGFGLHV